MNTIQGILCFSLVLSLSCMACSTEYDVKVKTGSSYGAGTDAHVKIILVGTKTTSTEHGLDGSFERGSLDTFVIKDITDLGDIVAIKVWRDENGFFPKWQLDKIGVRSRVTGKWFMFEYNAWTKPNKWHTIALTCDPGYKKNPQTGTCDGPICGSKPPLVTSRTLGGTQAVPGSWPWQAILEFQRGHARICSGTLILPQWVLTTAWCVYGKTPSMMAIRLGATHLTNKASSEQYIGVKDVYIHPDYHKYAIFSHDIAVIKLSRPVTLTDKVKPVCLPQYSIPLPVGDPTKRCWYTGWSRQSSTLFQAPIPLVPKATCVTLNQKMHDSMLCGYEARNDTGPCVADRGGPLSCETKGKWYLEGLISTGTDCYIKTPKKRIFSKLRFLEDWVENTINDNRDF